MKKSQLVQLIREELRGFSKYAPQGVTKGGTTDDFMQILTAIAKGDTKNYQGDPDKGENIIINKGNVKTGHDILNRANQKNVDRILRGEKPIYEQDNLEKYTVFFYTNDDDHDWDVMATSEEDAIERVKSGQVKGPYGQELPRLARKFSAKKRG